MKPIETKNLERQTMKLTRDLFTKSIKPYLIAAKGTEVEVTGKAGGLVLIKVPGRPVALAVKPSDLA